LRSDSKSAADVDGDGSASIELECWYQARLRPRLARAARLGIVDPGRVAALERDVSVLLAKRSHSGGAGAQPIRNSSRRTP
jgi:hypothetical protein